jgi:hypothetical protein
MPNSWAQGTFNGIELTQGGDPIKCFILDGPNLLSNRSVNNRFGADGTVYTQGFNHGGRGRKVGLRFPSLPVDKFNEMIESAQTSIDNNEPILIDVADDVLTFSREVVPDGDQWLLFPEQITNERFFNDVVMRFITVS